MPRATALITAVILAALTSCGGGAARGDDGGGGDAPPPPTNDVHVSTEPALQQAVRDLASDTTIVVAAGTYVLTNTLHFDGGLTNVGIRGATGSPAGVVLVGRGMTNADYGNVPHVIMVSNVQGIRIADLTACDVYYHPITLQGPSGCQAPHISNCRLIDAGEQFIKSNPGSGFGVDNGIVEDTLMKYTTTCRDAYTNGVDVLGGRDWTIRRCTFRNIRAAPGFPLAGPSVLMWRGCVGTVTEECRFFNCERGISYGLGAQAADHTGGIIRNNVFHRGTSESGDVAIYVHNSENTKVLNNTVVLSGTYANAIEYRGTTTGCEIHCNLTDAAILSRNGGQAALVGNKTDASPTDFVDASAGDLHIGAGSGAVNTATVHADVTRDIDGETRPRGIAPDIGADER